MQLCIHNNVQILLMIMIIIIQQLDVRNRFFILVWFRFGFLKKSDSVQSEFVSVRLKKRGSLWILYLLIY